jgi:hypothetical protein
VQAQLELPDHKDQQVLPDQKVTLVQLDHKDQQVLILELQDRLDQKVTPVQLVRKVLREIQALQVRSILITEHLPSEV